MRAAILTSAALAAWAPWLLVAGSASAGQRADAQLRAIVVGASGRGSEASFDRRIPEAFRKQLRGCHLAYTRYDLLGMHRKPARFGAEIRFALPEKEALAVVSTRNESRSHPLRIGVRVLDRERKVLQKIQVRVPFDRIFLIHRPKGPKAIIMGVSAHKPPDD
jgi:hypothetical protein